MTTNHIQANAVSNLDQIFHDTQSMLNIFRVFGATYHTVPSIISGAYIEVEKALEWFVETQKDEVLTEQYVKAYKGARSSYELQFYLMKSPMLVYFSVERKKVAVLFDPSLKSKAENWPHN